MAFRFPLQKVLEFRKIEEDLAQRDFQEATALFQQELRVLEKMQLDLTQSIYGIQNVIEQQDQNPSPALTQTHEYQILQRRCIEVQKAKVRDCENKVEEKREILRQKAIDHKIMVRLREKKQNEYVQERRSEEQKSVDELNVLRHRLRDQE